MDRLLAVHFLAIPAFAIAEGNEMLLRDAEALGVCRRKVFLAGLWVVIFSPARSFKSVKPHARYG